MTSELEALIEARECLDCLTPRQREAVRLRLQNHTFQEIGDIMGISAPAAYYLYSRGADKLNKGGS